jgi:hypothetical protein
MKSWESLQPKIWTDFMESRISSLPPAQSLDAVAGHAALALKTLPRNEALVRGFETAEAAAPEVEESIRLLRRSGSLVVLANLAPCLLGGPLAQLLKCLTAIKLCRRLVEQSIPAVPVGWIHSDPVPVFPVDQ